MHMAKFVSLFVERSNRRLLVFALWLMTFVAVGLFAAAFGAHELNQQMVSEARRVLDPQIQLRANIASTWAQMQQRLTAAPCSPAIPRSVARHRLSAGWSQRIRLCPRGRGQVLGRRRCRGLFAWRAGRSHRSAERVDLVRQAARLLGQDQADRDDSGAR